MEQSGQCTNRYFDALDYGLLALDRDLQILMTNPAARNTFPNLTQGGMFCELYPELYVALIDYIDSAFDGTGCRIERFEWWINGVEFFFMLDFLPIENCKGCKPTILLLFDDITERVILSRQFEEQYAELGRQLSIARKYQTTLFTDELITAEFSCRAFEKPAFELSGDFFNTSQQHGCCQFVLGDVQSHGIDVALKAVTIQHLCSLSLAQHAQITKAAAELNQFVLHDDVNNPWTCCLLLVDFDPEARTGKYVRAGIPEPVIFRADGSFELLDVGQTPLGYFPDETYEAGSFRVSPGDRLLMFSDGVTESRLATVSGRLYGHENLIPDYRKLAKGSDHHHLLDLVNSVELFHGETSFGDDFTMAEIIFR